MAGGSNPTWDILRLQGSATPGVCTDHHRSMPTRSQTRYAFWGMSMDFPASHAAWLATFDDWRVKPCWPTLWIVGQWFFEGPVDHSGSLYQDTYNYFQCMQDCLSLASYLHHIISVSLKIGDPKVEIFPVDHLPMKAIGCGSFSGLVGKSAGPHPTEAMVQMMMSCGISPQTPLI